MDIIRNETASETTDVTVPKDENQQPSASEITVEEVTLPTILEQPDMSRYSDPIRNYLRELHQRFDWTDREWSILTAVRELHVSRMEEIEFLLSTYLITLYRSKSSNPRRSHRNQSERTNSGDYYGSRSSIKQHLYKKCQQSFKKNTRSLAAAIIDEKPTSQETSLPPFEEVVGYFRDIFSPSSDIRGH